MACAMAMPVNAPRDSVQRIHRITRENRSLWYQLTVLQQPERARACGSGMKANSDRRPVDPPPVVELRIIEGPTVEEGKDITFDYNANFFLYASLEQARTLAHGRVQSAAATNPPILTGVPASGMAYLDRPAEAGYFIFPDLSVRHEGYFCLSFSLFETTKEAKDFDMEPADPDLPLGVDWRMEIKTQPFNVFSAKKFPGLMESTQLSKTVADQGCRVRIRRDVRMRKRDGKGAAYERREDECRRRTVTPTPRDPHDIRARSRSDSGDRRLAYGAEAARRPSGVDAHHPAPAPPPPPPSGYDAALSSRGGGGGGGHVVYPEHSAPPYGHPRPHVLPPQQTTMHHMAPSSTAQPYSSTLSSPYGKTEQTSYGHAHHARSVSSTCPSPAPSVRPDLQYERNTGGYAQPSPPAGTARQPSRRASLQQNTYSCPPPTMVQQQQQQQQPQPRPKSCAPSTMAAAPAPAAPASSSLAPLKIAYLVSPSPLPPIEPQTEPDVATPTSLTGDKRKRDHVFPQALRPLHNGQRQRDAHFDRLRGLVPDIITASYSRANGQTGMVNFNDYNKP